jgi:hypothetical protein
MTYDEQQRDLEQQVMRYRAMEREVTDPLAIRLLQDIVEEMEAALEQQPDP